MNIILRYIVTLVVLYFSGYACTSSAGVEGVEDSVTPTQSLYSDASHRPDLLFSNEEDEGNLLDILQSVPESIDHSALTSKIRKILHQENIFIQEVIGVGTQGTVYLARKPDTEKETDALSAIKEVCFCPEGTITSPANNGYVTTQQSSAAHGYFRHVNDKLKRLQATTHPNIVSVHQIVIDNDSVFTVMDYHPHTMSKVVSKYPSRQLGPHQVKSITRQLLHASEYLLHHSLVHKDIRPDNLLIAEDQKRVLITDFDLLESIPAEDSASDSVINLLTGHVNNFSPVTASEFFNQGYASAEAIHAAAIAATHIELRTGQRMLDTFFQGYNLADHDQVIDLLRYLHEKLYDRDSLAKKIDNLFHSAHIIKDRGEIDFLVTLMMGQLHPPDSYSYLQQ